MRVPTFIRGPGIAPGSTISEITLHIDLAPTIASLVGTAPPKEADVDGRSFAPLLFGETGEVVPWRTDMLFEFWCDNPQGTPRVVRGPYCDHVMCSSNNTYAGVLTSSGLKYVEFQDDVHFVEFYDLRTGLWHP